MRGRTEWKRKTRVDQVRGRKLETLHGGYQRGQGLTESRRDAAGKESRCAGLLVDSEHPPPSSQEFEGVSPCAESKVYSGSTSFLCSFPRDVIKNLEEKVPGRTLRGAPIVTSPLRRGHVGSPPCHGRTPQFGGGQPSPRLSYPFCTAPNTEGLEPLVQVPPVAGDSGDWTAARSCGSSPPHPSLVSQSEALGRSQSLRIRYEQTSRSRLDKCASNKPITEMTLGYLGESQWVHRAPLRLQARGESKDSALMAPIQPTVTN